MNATLYQLEDEIQQIEAMLDDPNLHDEDKTQAIDLWLKRQVNLSEKLDGYCQLIQTYRARQRMRESEAQRLTDLAKIDASRWNRLEERLKHYFEYKGWHKFDTPRFSLKVCAHGGLVPVHVPEDPMVLPEDYRRVKTEISADKAKIREALEKGITIDGCSIGERGRYLRIS